MRDAGRDLWDTGHTPPHAFLRPYPVRYPTKSGLFDPPHLHERLLDSNQYNRNTPRHIHSESCPRTSPRHRNITQPETNFKHPSCHSIRHYSPLTLLPRLLHQNGMQGVLLPAAAGPVPPEVRNTNALCGPSLEKRFRAHHCEWSESRYALLSRLTALFRAWCRPERVA